jgi:hypothetical protein
LLWCRFGLNKIFEAVCESFDLQTAFFVYALSVDAQWIQTWTFEFEPDAELQCTHNIRSDGHTEANLLNANEYLFNFKSYSKRPKDNEILGVFYL